MPDDHCRPAALHPAEWLSLAATPTFALMAVLAALPHGGAHQMSCSAAAMSSLGGMTVMYLLMSAFHCLPWVKMLGPGSNWAQVAGLGVAPQGAGGHRMAAHSPEGATIARSGAMGEEAELTRVLPAG